MDVPKHSQYGLSSSMNSKRNRCRASYKVVRNSALVPQNKDLFCNMFFVNQLFTLPNNNYCFDAYRLKIPLLLFIFFLNHVSRLP